MKTAAILAVIAEYELVCGISKEVLGLEGLASFWIHQQSGDRLHVVAAYQKAKNKAQKQVQKWALAPTKEGGSER